MQDRERNSSGPLTPLPLYHVFQRLGEALAAHTHYYPLALTAGGREQVQAKFTTAAPVSLPDAFAMGFGGPLEPREIVIVNHTARPLPVAVPGYRLAPRWTYGGREPLPHFKMNPVPWRDIPPTVPEPTVTPVAAASPEILVAPFSATFAVLSPIH